VEDSWNRLAGIVHDDVRNEHRLAGIPPMDNIFAVREDQY